jgi:pimeloyl-ACP methyl ester carboxylesterase
VIVPAPDGRTLRVHELGEGFPVVYHHGTPGTGMLFERWQTEGVRLIGYDRAGAGGSARNRGRRVADVAADIRAIADALDLDRFATWGISGGGPHALATAALLPERVVAVAALAAVAPADAEGLDFLAGQGEANLVEWQAARGGETALRPLLEQDLAALAAGGAAGFAEAMASLVTAPDRAALEEGVGEFLHASLAATGVDGWLDDDLAFLEPWGFDLASIRAPTLLVQGEQDLMVPPAHGRWLARRLPAAETRLEAAEGHLSLMLDTVQEVHAWLLQDRPSDRRS